MPSKGSRVFSIRAISEAATPEAGNGWRCRESKKNFFAPFSRRKATGELQWHGGVATVGDCIGFRASRERTCGSIGDLQSDRVRKSGKPHDMRLAAIACVEKARSPTAASQVCKCVLRSSVGDVGVVAQSARLLRRAGPVRLFEKAVAKVIVRLRWLKAARCLTACRWDASSPLPTPQESRRSP